MTFLPEGLSLTDTFRANARLLLDAGYSGNQILSSARELGFGIRRAEALNIIRDLREAQSGANAAAGAVSEITEQEPAREYKWGKLTQETDQFLRFDGPHALLFRV